MKVSILFRDSDGIVIECDDWGAGVFDGVRRLGIRVGMVGCAGRFVVE